MNILRIVAVIIISIINYGCATNGGIKEAPVYNYGCTKNYGCPKKKIEKVATRQVVVGKEIIHPAENKVIAEAIYANDYDTFASEYKRLENKDSIMFSYGHFKGEPLGYLALAMYLPDPRFFNLVVEYADPNIPNFAGLTALFLAPDFCALNKAKKLIAKGANVNYTSQVTGATPLHMVVGTQCYHLQNCYLSMAH